VLSFVNLYIILIDGNARAAYWTRAAAEEAMGRYQSVNPLVDVYIQTAAMEPIGSLVQAYFDHRGYVEPTTAEGFNFLVSEIGEFADALNQANKNHWVRNHPDEKHAHPEREGGDILMMLIKTMSTLRSDPIEQMVETFKEKGYDPAR
jgi:NTP pyrophosphatase (non-canonical NTP hydrolase)